MYRRYRSFFAVIPIQTEENVSNRAKLVTLLGEKCINCHYFEYPSILNFYRLHGKFVLGQNFNRRVDDLIKELPNFLLLCPLCFAKAKHGIIPRAHLWELQTKQHLLLAGIPWSEVFPGEP